MAQLWALDLSSTGYVEDYVNVTGDATHTHLATGGWDGEGAAKFTPPTDAPGGAYASINLWQSGVADGRRRVLRAVIEWGTTFAARMTNEDKLVIVNRASGQDEHRFIERINHSAGTLESCNNTLCEAAGTPYDIDEYAGEPIYLEWDYDLDAGTVKRYITTRDGVYNSTLNGTLELDDTSSNWGGGGSDFGGFFNAATTGAHADNYFTISLLEIHDTTVGPPEGFVTGGGGSDQTQGVIGSSRSRLRSRAG